MLIGAASKVITNSTGRPIQGASVANAAEAVRDECEANALVLDSGSGSCADAHGSGVSGAALLISCDLVGLERAAVDPVRDALSAAAEVPADAVIVAGTHMHSGPSLLRTNRDKAIDDEYLDLLRQRLVDVAGEARAAARPARLGWGVGQAQIGYNRRCCWADGSHTMHGDGQRPDFTGMEGPDDPAHLALFATDAEGQLLAILWNNTSHPTCFYGASFYSADFPGEARRLLREALGPVPVLFLNGAFGDIAIETQLHHDLPRESGEAKMRGAAQLAAGETLRLLHEARWHDAVPLRHCAAELEVDVRLPDPERADWATRTLSRVDAGEEVAPYDRMIAFGVHLLQSEYGKASRDRLTLHALRIGDVALLTQPCELYCQFGLDLKRRSPAPITGVVGIADGYAGYCPTLYGILGGGYSGEPLHWTRLAADAGYRIVDAGARLLREGGELEVPVHRQRKVQNHVQ